MTTSGGDTSRDLTTQGAAGAYPSGSGEILTVPSWPYGASDPLTASPTIGQLMHALRRRWPLAVGLGLLLATLLGALTWLLVPINQEVAGSLRVARDVPMLITSRGTDPGSEAFGNYRRTQAQLVKSPSVLASALDHDNIRTLPMVVKVLEEGQDPVSWLGRQINVSFPGDSEVMQISMRGEDADQMVRIVNAVQEAYLTGIVNKDLLALADRRRAIENRLRIKVEELASRNKVLTEMKVNVGDTKAADMERAMLLSQIGQLVQNMTNLQGRLLENELQAELIRSKSNRSSDNNIPDYLIDKVINEDPEVKETLLLIRQAKEQIANIRALDRRGENSQQAQDLKRQIEAYQEAIEVRRAELRPDAIKQVKATMTQGPLQDSTPAENLAYLAWVRTKIVESIETAREERDKKFERIQTLSRTAVNEAMLRPEIEQLNGIVASMQSEVNTIDQNLSVPPRVTKLEEARKPDSSRAFYRVLFIGFASTAGFGLALVSVVFAEFQARRLNNSQELSGGLGIRVLGTLPAMSRRRGSGASTVQGVVVESIDSIRTMLLQRGSPDAARIVLVTSASEHEGKTTVASQLAASLARAGRRTLLVDGAVRHPVIHGMFDVSLDLGLCEVLRNQTEVDETLQPTQIPNLWVMPAGHCDHESLTALSRDGAHELFARLRAEFDFVVIDSGPVLALADPLLLGTHADAAVLAVRRDVSQLAKVNEARERLEAVGIRLLGAVVNGIKPNGQRRVASLPAPRKAK